MYICSIHTYVRSLIILIVVYLSSILSLLKVWKSLWAPRADLNAAERAVGRSECGSMQSEVATDALKTAVRAGQLWLHRDTQN